MRTHSSPIARSSRTNTAMRLVLKFSALGLALALVSSPPAYSADPATVGAEQSPINISLDQLRFERLPALRFQYPSSLNLDCVNNGEIVRCSVPAGAATLRVGDETFNLLQFHWHTSSEHRLMGLTFPMEMHLVHQNASGKLLVVGVWFVPGGQNRELTKIFDHLPAKKDERSAVTGFNLTNLLPASRRSFRYNGSLTTPPYSEGVRWVVLDGVASASPLQFYQHLSVFPGGNARDPQPLNGRTVSTDIGSRH